MEIGIIGFGPFGQLLAKHLKNKAEVFVTDHSDKGKQAREAGVNFVSLSEAARKQIVILAVPTRNLKEVLLNIKNILQPGTLVLDVCSCKVLACKVMNEILPKGIEIIGTHPLFGPQSAKNGLDGLKMVLCNIRTSRLEKVITFCESFGLKVIVSTPEEHDRQMALAQALTHFIAKVIKVMDVNNIDLSTKAFDKLMEVVEMVKEDSEVLFQDIQTLNPFAEEVRQKFTTEFIELNKKLAEIAGVNF